MKNLIGQKFGRLSPLKFFVENKRSFWECKCDCGNFKTVMAQSLTCGATRSCGCLNDETRRLTKHGACKNGKTSPSYKTWDSMVQRCTNPNNRNYHHYGGRGITICEKWLDFAGFLDDMGERPVGKSIERKNNMLGYSKENCVWATQQEQVENRRNNILVTIQGTTQTAAKWADQNGIDRKTVYGRINDGWSKEDAVQIPVTTKSFRRKPSYE